MSTISSYEVTDLTAQHVERWRRLHEERRFRVGQLAVLKREPPSGRRAASVNQALRIAATAILRDVDAALARIDEGRYGLCMSCDQPIPDARLDVLPMAPLCMSCHYNEQNCRVGSD